MTNKKILIIEDEKTLHKALAEYLEAENFIVSGAFDGEKGLEMIKAEKPDLVVLDIVLPKKDGFQVLEEVKNDQAVKNIPVILLTNLESMEDIQKAFDKGATTYLVKSEYKLEDIVKKINETLK